MIIIIFYLYLKSNNNYENFINECPNFTDISQNTHILMAPNIPDDPKFIFKIGGKYLPFNTESLAPDKGKYKFPIRDFKYDGIFKNYNKIYQKSDYAIEINKWVLDKLYDYSNAFFTDKYFILPNKYSNPGFKELDELAFYKPRLNTINTNDG